MYFRRLLNLSNLAAQVEFKFNTAIACENRKALTIMAEDSNSTLDLFEWRVVEKTVEFSNLLSAFILDLEPDSATIHLVFPYLMQLKNTMCSKKDKMMLTFGDALLPPLALFWNT